MTEQVEDLLGRSGTVKVEEEVNYIANWASTA